MYSKIQILLGLLAVPLAAWFVVHLLAFFGIFIAVIYPIWWLLSPYNFAPCLYCLSKPDKNNFKCPVCLREFRNGALSYRNPFIAIIRNVVLILLFTILSFGLVWLESKFLSEFSFPYTPKTVSFIIPSQRQYRLGEVFPLKIELTGIKIPINTVQTDISYNPDRLNIVDISTQGSFATIFIQKEINNSLGYARLTGGLPNPGFSSKTGIFGTIYFKGVSPGIAKVDFLPSSMILANNGRGSNVLTGLNSASYIILPEKISRQEEDLQINLVKNKQVLGESSENTQIKLYQDTDILGIKSEPQKPTFFGYFMTAVEKIDSFILDLWQKLFNKFF